MDEDGAWKRAMTAAWGGDVDGGVDDGGVDTEAQTGGSGCVQPPGCVRLAALYRGGWFLHVRLDGHPTDKRQRRKRQGT